MSNFSDLNPQVPLPPLPLPPYQIAHFPHFFVVHHFTPHLYQFSQSAIINHQLPNDHQQTGLNEPTLESQKNQQKDVQELQNQPQGLSFLQKILKVQSELLLKILENSKAVDKQMNSLSSSLRQILQTNNMASGTSATTVTHESSRHIEQKEYMSKLISGQIKVNFSLKLQLDVPFETPLYREKVFSLAIKLLDQKGELFENKSKISLTVLLYSSQCTPKRIFNTLNGLSVLRGKTSAELVQGRAVFNKLQIRQVTSHFQKGWIYLVVKPEGEFFEKMNSIQPLIIKNIVVKAKKPIKLECKDQLI